MTEETDGQVRAGITITPDGLMKMALGDPNPESARIKMIKTVKDHISHPDAQHDGVVVAVREQDQREEVPALITEMGLTNEQYGVRTLTEVKSSTCLGGRIIQMLSFCS